jgi:hypothetical protein
MIVSLLTGQELAIPLHPNLKAKSMPLSKSAATEYLHKKFKWMSLDSIGMLWLKKYINVNIVGIL